MGKKGEKISSTSVSITLTLQAKKPMCGFLQLLAVFIPLTYKVLKILQTSQHSISLPQFSFPSRYSFLERKTQKIIAVSICYGVMESFIRNSASLLPMVSGINCLWIQKWCIVQINYILSDGHLGYF